MIRDSHEQSFLKVAMKKERTTYLLYSENEVVLHEWRAQMLSIAKRRNSNSFLFLFIFF